MLLDDDDDDSGADYSRGLRNEKTFRVEVCERFMGEWNR